MNSITKSLIYVFLTTILLSSCYVSKPLENEVNATVNTEFDVQLDYPNNGYKSFITNYTADEYRNKFIEGLKGELSYSKININPNQAKYHIEITEIKVIETQKEKVIDDPDSPDNGKKYLLSSADLVANGFVKNLETGKTVNWIAYKDKDEKATNNRSLGQIIIGTNKDETEYREKQFADNTILILTNKLGKRSGVRIAKTIGKMQGE